MAAFYSSYWIGIQITSGALREPFPVVGRLTLWRLRLVSTTSRFSRVRAKANALRRDERLRRKLLTEAIALFHTPTGSVALYELLIRLWLM